MVVMVGLVGQYGNMVMKGCNVGVVVVVVVNGAAGGAGVGGGDIV